MNTQTNESVRRAGKTGIDPKVLRLVESAVMLGLATALSMTALSTRRSTFGSMPVLPARRTDSIVCVFI